MMYIAEDPVQHVVRVETPAIHDTAGRMIAPKQRRIVIQFQRGHAPMWVRDLALKRFEFRKRPVEIPAETWVSWYDSLEDQQARGWTDEERKAIEEYLSGAYDVVPVELPRIAAPWPGITKLAVAGKTSADDVAARMAELADETGIGLGDVVAYVKQEQGKHGWNEQLVAALELLAQQPADPVKDDGERVAA